MAQQTRIKPEYRCASPGLASLPWPFSRSRWWVRPIRAERLAALRIGLAAVLLADIFLTYLPIIPDFFGPDNLISAAPFRGGPTGKEITWLTLLLRGSKSIAVARVVTLIWAMAACTLLLGFWSRTSAALAWLLSLAFYNGLPAIHDGGDQVRVVGLFYLFLSPCGAIWSVDHWLRNHAHTQDRPVYIAPWSLRLLFIQLVAIYFFSGIAKMTHPIWRDGYALVFVLGDVNRSLSSLPITILPEPLIRFLGVFIATWEIAFPILVLFPLTRWPTLIVGIGFHLSLVATVRLGFFPLYMICLYLPLFPWEHMTRLVRRRADGGTMDRADIATEEIRALDPKGHLQELGGKPGD